MVFAMRLPSDPQEYLKAAYLGEIGGEAFFQAVDKVLPERVKSLGLLIEVEQTTGALIAEHLGQAVSEEERASAQAGAKATVAAWTELSWEQFLSGSLPIVEEALEAFEYAQSQAPEELRQIYQTITNHEEALLRFIQKELQGEVGDAALESYLADPVAQANS